MWNYLWPALLVVASNVAYHISAKETPEAVNAFLSLTVTYLVGAAFTLGLYLATSGAQQDILRDLKNLNWTSYLLGLVIVGLEAGNLYLYRAGWKISLGSLVCNISVAAVLLVVGILFYKEVLGYKQIIGLLLCIAGLVFINS
ncbi:MAG: EamA family transporter [Candidatus Pelethousia sp.]|nr:EamA family transporter [Candidatus Pelethousia sp.]